MGLALDTVSGRVLNSNGVLTAITANTGDSVTVRNFNDGASASIVDINGLCSTAATLQYRSPRMHDNLQDYRWAIAIGDSRSLWPKGALQKLYAQDTLTISETSGAADTSITSMLVFYQDLPGVNAQLRTWDAVRSNIVNMATVVTSHTTNATVGEYSTSVALNGGVTDILKANVSYALLGVTVDTRVGRICLRGPDTGNLRVSAPGELTRQESRMFYPELSMWTGLPTVPVINAANKASTFVDLTHNVGGATVVVTSLFAELSS